MLPEYDISKLERAMYDFNKATGVSITLYNSDEKPVTTMGMGESGYCSLIGSTGKGRASCRRSNKLLLCKCKESRQIAKHICGGGLLDIAIPILHAGEPVGYLMIGQIRLCERFPLSEETFDIDFGMLEKEYNAIPQFTEEKVISIINIATMLTKYIMLENMVHSHRSKNLKIISSYINMHLKERLSADSISRATHISKSGIYKCIRSSYNCTLGEFIKKRRIEKSLPLIEGTELSIFDIAEEVGFTDVAYFSKSFKKQQGVSPLKYRKSLRYGS